SNGGDWVGYETPSLWMERACTTSIAAANGVLATLNQPTFDVLQPTPPELPVRVVSAGVRGLRALFGPMVRVGRKLRGK
ncbi:MAG: hypothetical protein AAGK74_18395, partial [Chloroflexota bacterium]